MLKRTIALLLVTFASVGVANAHTVNNLQTLTQQAFKGFSTDLGGIIQPNQLMGAAPEGITGFDLGLTLNYTPLAHKAAWRQATGSSISGVPNVGLRVSKGLPFNLDVGGFYTTAPTADFKTYGLALRYAVLEGGPLVPAIGLRATYSKVSGIDNLSFNSKSLGVSISKGFAFITPFIGYSHIWASSNPATGLALQSESIGENQLFGGIDIGLGLFNLVIEAERTGDNTSYSAKLALGF